MVTGKAMNCVSFRHRRISNLPQLRGVIRAHSVIVSRDPGDYPRWLVQRNRPTKKDRLNKCFVVRPFVRFRHSLNEDGFRCFRISLMTCPGSSPNCSRIASNVVRSSQAICITLSVCAASKNSIFQPSFFVIKLVARRSSIGLPRRQRWLQYLTASQVFNHFRRQVIGLQQTAHVLLGIFSFFIGYEAS